MLGRISLLAVVGTGVALAVAAGRSLRRFAIVEDSMRPAFEPGDWVLARRLRGAPRRGAVVVYEHPHRPGMHLVKRVVGLAGERLAIAGGRVLVDGNVLADPWAVGPTGPPGAWHAPDEAVFLLGDRRAVSAGDSRTTGPVPDAGVRFEVVARYWPRARSGLV